MKKLLSSLAVVTLIGVTSISVVTCGGERPYLFSLNIIFSIRLIIILSTLTILPLT